MSSLTARFGRTVPSGWTRSLLVRGLVIVVLAVIGALNLLLVGRLVIVIATQPAPPDWLQFREAAQRLLDGTGLYAVTETYQFRWSPLAAALLVPLTALGPTVWQLGQLVGAAVLPTMRLRLAMLATVPFWSDLQAGNTMTWVFGAAAWAVSGSAVAGGIFLGLTLLIPRPIMLPVAIWLLWRRPTWRLPFIGICVAYAGVLLLIGQLGPWLTVLMSAAPEEFAHPLQISPSAVIGAAWIPIGLALAAFLTYKERLGWASLAAAPYLFLYYVMFGFLELVRIRRPDAAAATPGQEPVPAPTIR